MRQEVDGNSRPMPDGRVTRVLVIDDEAPIRLLCRVNLEAEGIEWMAYPQFTGDYDINATNLPSARYAWLLGIEQNAMRRTGKRGEYEFCRDEAQHPLMTQFQDFVIEVLTADEHVDTVRTMLTIRQVKRAGLVGV